ncbi:putative dehydrogenase [Marinitoga piezophila KA3]|uniref:Putative dehydrogenase n=1 Tax=Marinitoga piezophila (strain DSM 14283 / JCM 11233 / KA3) TaxID=443254 RepID=H2J3B4_MARPK|nr:NAD(P)/FAD-dependent oxidoreductase [Marinitoga piezophila]AEX85730.1 putative dehydrogenase [Marinitoga piezophila KA3]
MIAVIGGGIVGTLIARELNKYEKDVYLFEAKTNFGMGVTKSNSAVLHGGYDDPPGTMRAKLCYMGNQLYTELQKELNFDMKRVGSHVVAIEDEETHYIYELLKKAERNGVKGVRIVEKLELLEMEPNINPRAKRSLYAEFAGIFDPWMVAIQAAKSVRENGGKTFIGKTLIDVEKKNNKFLLKFSDNTTFEADIVINATGLYADEIAKMFGDEVPEIFPVKGEYFLLSKDYNYVNSIIFPVPTGISKGCLVLPTVDGGFLVGPNANRVISKKDTATTREGLNEVKEKGMKLVPNLNFRRHLVKTFAGLRPETEKKDFYIDVGKSGAIHVSGIRSPGLTAAPAIAKYVVDYLIQEKLGINLSKRNDYNPITQRTPHLVHIDRNEWNKIIQEDPNAGEMICHCNKVTKKEIIDAINNGARTLDDIKFMTRASFGECQGGFCTAKILKILAEYTGRKPEEITQNEKGTWIVNSKVRI